MEKTKAEESSKFRRFAARRPRTVLLLVNVVGIAIVLLLVEIVLRAWGLVPGYLDMGHDDFRPLPKGQTLTVSREYYTDSIGIFRALPDSFNRRPGYHVNSWGFRGPEFDLKDSSRKKIMLIGDSFTWGAHATPIDSSYADRLRRPGYQILNFGIPGTEPDQYERIAERYLDTVKPDMVCLFFYMGNDVMGQPKIVLPNSNIYHITNVGWLNAYLEGGYIGGPEETYNYYLKRFNLPPNNLFNRFCALTVIGTRVWQVMDQLKWVDEQRPDSVGTRKAKALEMYLQGPYSGPHVRHISEMCAERSIPFRMFVIPKHDVIERPDTAAMPTLFSGTPYLYLEGLTADDYYGRPDGHFNNKGHRKMAEFVRREIERVLGGAE